MSTVFPPEISPAIFQRWAQRSARRGDGLPYPKLDLALLYLGGTRLLGIMVTSDGQQGRRVDENLTCLPPARLRLWTEPRRPV